MQTTGMLYGSRLLKYVDFPTSEVLGPDASEEDIQGLIDRHKMIFIKPVFKGGVGKKGKSGLIGKATDLKRALQEKERLYFAEHRHGNATAKSNGVTFESGIPAEHEVYFSITDSTIYRAPMMTLTHMGGMDIEELDKSQVANIPFDPLTGLKAFVVAKCAIRHRCAQGSHFTAGPAPAETVGACAPLRTEHLGIEPHPNAPRPRGTPDPRRLRLQM